MSYNSMFTGAQLDQAIGTIIGMINSIGVAGTAGFGVGIAPLQALPAGMTPLPSYAEPAHPNYGNYQFADGSIMVWLPKFYYRIGHADNPTYATYGVNSVDIKGVKTFATTYEANAAGYALHRAFIDGGIEQPGVFVDKYMASRNALGTGFVASSIQGGLPISTASIHNPIAGLTACSSNYHYEVINAAHARDGINGAVNPDSQFFCCSRFIHAAMALISLAHGQAATSALACDWYDPAGITNFPKGCNTDALGDINDASVAYSSDGYSNCARTGSGTPVAKTTHNGQNCGCADLNGLMYEVNLGVTCVANNKSITAANKANPCVLTITGHGYTTGDHLMIEGVGGMTQIKDKIFSLTVVDADNISLDNVDSSGFTTYTSGGTATNGTFYVPKAATAMRDFTAGLSLSTDHWGAAGCTAMMDSVNPAFGTTYPDNGYSMLFGNAENQVLSAALAGNDYILAGLGLPIGGCVSAGGSNLFGTDSFYQYIRNELCLLSSRYWHDGAGAGVWGLNLSNSRTYSTSNVGFRAACYPVS